MKKEAEISAWARAIYLAIDEHPENMDKVIKNLILSLGKKKYLLPAIVKKFEKIYKKEKKLEVYLANEIDEETKKRINRKITETLGIKEPATYSIDKELIGGFRVQTKDYLIKASIKDALIKIKNSVYGYNQ